MKILIDGRLYGLENAGLGRYAINLIEYLSKLDKKNEYFVLLRKKYYDELVLPENWTKILADFRHYSFAEQIKLPKILKNIKPDITHFLHFNVPIFWKGKFIVTIHDLLMHQYVGLSATTLSAPLYGIKRIAYKKVFSEAVKKSLKIIVPSGAVKNEIVRQYKILEDKVKIIYEGVDREIGIEEGSSKIFAKYKINSDYFIYSGNAYPHKNLQRLVEAIVLLNKNSTHKIKLLIVSSRTIFTQRLQKLISKLNANDLVDLLGFVPDSDLGSLYKYSKGFVAASLSEGFGLPGLEALQSGTLIAVSDIPVFREIYKNCATYFNPYDFTSIEKAMRSLLDLPQNDRNEMIEEGKKLAQTYSWDKMARETLKIYESEGGNNIR